MLFLIGNHRVSKLSLECVVIVCDRSKSADCDAVINSCIVHKDCATDGNFVEDTKCKSYYTCKDGKKGAAQACFPDSLYYDVTQKICTTKVPSGCKDPVCTTDGSYTTNAKCTSYYTCASGFRGAVKTCATGTYYDVTQKVCTTVVPSGCQHPRCDGRPNGDRLLNNECKGKFNCNWGFLTETNCPSGQYMNKNTWTCQQELPTGCHHPSCVANGDGTYRDDSTKCSKAYVCDKGTRTDYDCKAPTPFYQDGQCVDSNDFRGCEHPACPSTYTGLISDDPKCKKVELCIAGSGWLVEDICGETGDGTHYFDKSKNACIKTNIPPPGCGTPNVDCLPAGDTLGKDYRGKWAETVQGGACIKWEDALSGMPSDKPTWPAVGDRDHAYCRNPEGDGGGPYCFVAHYKHVGADWSDTYQYCKPIPECT